MLAKDMRKEMDTLTRLRNQSEMIFDILSMFFRDNEEVEIENLKKCMEEENGIFLTDWEFSWCLGRLSGKYDLQFSGVEDDITTILKPKTKNG